MLQKTVKCEALSGLQVRPASEIVKKAKEYESEITLTVDGKEASAKSLFKLQTLDINLGTEILVAADGDDEQTAVDAIIAVIQSLRD
jgi:phosphocarrier protein HPr